MKHAFFAAAVIAASGLLAAPAAAAPPQTYDGRSSRSSTRRTRSDDPPLAVAQVRSPNATLPNGPNWQFSSSVSGKQTGVANPVSGQVVYAGTGATPADFPAGSAGKIVLLDYGADAAARNAQVANAVAAGAIGIILGTTTVSAAGIPAAPPTVTITPVYPEVPIMGAGRSHLDWMKALLAAGPLTLSFTTENYINPTRAVVVARRFAVGDPNGTRAPIVMVGAHIDSVLGAPGAHDDASGNGVAIEIARVVSKLPLDKEIRIGGFGGEEDGLTGSRAYVATLPPEERARFVGEWQMDMVGTPYEPARLWALTPNGLSNFVVDEAYKAAERFGFSGLQNCRLGQSDHQAFFDVGIPSALFIWLDYRKPPSGICGSTGGTYVTEPEYHRPTDGMNNVSPERLQTTLDVVGGAFAHNALNRVDITARSGNGNPLAGAAVTGDCGDGVRNFGSTGADGRLLDIRVPHATCDFTVGNGTLGDVVVDGDAALAITSAEGPVSGTVPATLSLTLGGAGGNVSFGAFTPGITRTYTASTTANVISTAGDATLTVSDPSPNHPGHLVNGAFVLPQPVKAAGSALPAVVKTYTGPVTNDSPAVEFTQLINATDALRTGAYAKTLTFTLSTTNP